MKNEDSVCAMGKEKVRMRDEKSSHAKGSQPGDSSSFLLHPSLKEIFRFGIVGILAVAIQYVVYLLALKAMSPGFANTVAYLVSFTFNYFASTYFTFRVKASVRRGAGFALSHVINYLLQMGALHLFLWMGISEEWAPLPMFCVCVPMNFLLVRFFLKR